MTSISSCPPRALVTGLMGVVVVVAFVVTFVTPTTKRQSVKKNMASSTAVAPMQAPIKRLQQILNTLNAVGSSC